MRSFLFTILVPVLASTGCESQVNTQSMSSKSAYNPLKEYCEKSIGKPRVVNVTKNVAVSIGHDLANVAMIQTSAGKVMVDTGMNRKRAKLIKDALWKKDSGPVKAILLTHSHIDHVGGAAEFIDSNTEIWGTENFKNIFFSGYGGMRPEKLSRAIRMFGLNVPDTDLPCSSIGRRIDFAANRNTAAMMPSKTFTGIKKLTIGDTQIELVEAHGETNDQLFVWLPKERVLFPGDNFYAAFPNLYTIRGTTARDVESWVKSIDAMRARKPKILVPGHTNPIIGEKEVERALRDYRDAIQWTLDETTRRVNARQTLDEVVNGVKLPKRLAQSPYLAETYGHITWSVRALYNNQVGWFDGRAENLYPMIERDALTKEVKMMGGINEVIKRAEEGLATNQIRWSIHLLSKLMKVLDDNDNKKTKVKGLLAEAYDLQATNVMNTNGRAYLLQTAHEIRKDWKANPRGFPSAELAYQMPLNRAFQILASRYQPPKKTLNSETIEFNLTDLNLSYFMTTRNGIVEILEHKPTSRAMAKVSLTSRDFKKMVISGFETEKLTVSGDKKRYSKYMKKFLF